MRWKEAQVDMQKNYGLRGSSYKRKKWPEGKFVYYHAGYEISAKMGYGYGEYLGEPSFLGAFVLKDTANQLHMGWQPSKGDIAAKDWVKIK
jgi:hypothetical protein